MQTGLFFHYYVLHLWFKSANYISAHYQTYFLRGLNRRETHHEGDSKYFLVNEFYLENQISQGVRVVFKKNNKQLFKKFTLSHLLQTNICNERSTGLQTNSEKKRHYR